MKILKNKYNPNEPKEIITARQFNESFDKLMKADKWFKVKIFRHGVD